MKELWTAANCEEGSPEGGRNGGKKHGWEQEEVSHEHIVALGAFHEGGKKE